MRIHGNPNSQNILVYFYGLKTSTHKFIRLFAVNCYLFHYRLAIFCVQRILFLVSCCFHKFVYFGFVVYRRTIFLCSSSHSFFSLYCIPTKMHYLNELATLSLSVDLFFSLFHPHCLQMGVCLKLKHKVFTSKLPKPKPNATQPNKCKNKAGWMESQRYSETTLYSSKRKIPN